MSDKTVIAILIDALRHDFITPENMPFLDSLKKKAFYGSLEEPFGFVPRAAIFAGLSPEQSGYLSYYGYRPPVAPFRWFSHWPRAGHGLSRRVFEGLLNWRKVLGLNENTFLSVPRQWDDFSCRLDVMERFPPYDARFLTQKTLFDALREKGASWCYLGYPRTRQTTSFLEKHFYRVYKERDSFIWVHFSEVDWAMHQYGPDSKRTAEKLQRIDGAIERMAAHATKKGGRPISLLVFGDHGATAVTKTVDIQAVLRKKEAAIRSMADYYADSTLLYLWCRNKKEGATLDRLLQTLQDEGMGRLISAEQRSRYGIRFKTPWYGTHLFIAPPGTLFLPNIFQAEKQVMGMHGYLPDDADNRAAFLLASPDLQQTGKSGKAVPMVDICPTLAKLLSVEMDERAMTGKVMDCL